MATSVCVKRRMRWVLGFAAAVPLLCVLPCSADSATVSASQVEPVRPAPVASIIFGKDTRTRVADTTRFPWSAIGLVICDYGRVLHLGTGVMIGQKTVMTAAHVIYDQDLGWPSSIKFVPGQAGLDEPFGEATAESHLVPGQWVQGNGEYDIGLIVLDRTIGQETGYLQLAAQPDAFFTNQALISAGYPGDLSRGDTMYSITGSSSGVEGKRIIEQITTEDGQSGSPVWFMSSGAPLVVGVITGWREITQAHGPIISQGLSTRIDTDFGAWINSTLAQHGDVTQPGLSSSPSTIPTTSTTATLPLFGCGAGVTQALLASTLAWTLCLVSRRSWRSPR